ncbi:hypothetical protein CAC42_386 [Sphaceloma murrayae]|uniref:Rrn9 domain-containing protein n=1 Tax=Sphaceloma murrayae TaxID=2082308 RepID=A0A2K1R3D9_9PEZI|nr:hypothetical protein CAC42_386 [Sphaceloma murrayae]
MSLFGGDSVVSGDASSNFSISPIPSSQAELSADAEDTQDAQSDGGIVDLGSPASLEIDEETISPRTDIESRDGNDGRTRFQGSDSLWRFHTKDERGLAQTLFDARADDLSTHLYNAHAWKASLRAEGLTTDDITYTRKSRWVEGTSATQDKRWYPTEAWTLWPMESDSVPRPRERFWRRSTAATAATPADSTSELRAELMALGLRIVKEQWGQRPGQQTPRQMFPTPSSPERSRSRSRASSNPMDGTDDSQHSSDRHSSEMDAELVRPVLSADTVNTEMLFRPILSAVQARLDNLLLALHHNRAGHHAVGRDDDSINYRRSSLSRSRSRSVGAMSRRHSSDASEPAEPDDEDRQSRPTKRRRITRGDKRASSTASSNSSASGSDGEHHRAPRDWSEVFGLAGLIGWDEAALHRAHSRCESLFGERMTFRAMEEHAQVEDAAFDDAPDHESNNPRQHPTFDPDVGYLCPFDGCKRASKPFPITHGWRFREHLHRKHGLSRDQIKDIENGLGVSNPRQPASSRNPRGWIPPIPLSCPHRDCSARDKIYPEPRRLVDHLKRIHQYDPRTHSPPPSSRPQSSAGEISEAETGSDVLSQAGDFMVGGVHNDGFMVPIGSKIKRNRRTGD